MLLSDTFTEMLEIADDTVDLGFGRREVGGAHQRRGARQSAAGAVDDREAHREIAQQFLTGGRRRGIQLLLGF